MTQKSPISDAVLQKANQWLKDPFDLTTQKKVKALLENSDPKDLVDAFYTDLSFGTAGLRGLMGVGTNRLNEYTIARATQGLAHYILKHASHSPSVAIAYDSRQNSQFFAETAAKVLAAHDIQVFLCSDIRPTPFLSFLCRHRNCAAAIMITASHNPPDYNGYKVYWNDGAQVVPPHDMGIMHEVNSITDFTHLKLSSFPHPLIHLLGVEDDEAYLHALAKLQNFKEEAKQHGGELHILFSNLHGTAITLLPHALFSWGFSNLHYVEEQKAPNGLFPTTNTPNPELKEALALGIDKLVSTKADIFLATDPDADRIGIVVYKEGKPYILNGNQIAIICLYHLLKTFKSKNKLSSNHAVLSTIVTTRALEALCKNYNIHYFDVLTGFKYIGEKIKQFEEKPPHYQFLFGAEESFGFLYGTHARDKDAIITACLISEIALLQKRKNQTLIDLLYEVYKHFGVYEEMQLSISLPEGEESQHKIAHAMDHLRKNPQSSLDHISTIRIDDYLTSSSIDLKTHTTHNLTLPKSNVLVYHYEDKSTFVIRPSGTEPKIKIYGMLRQDSTSDIESLLIKGKTILNKRLLEIRKTYLNL